MEITKSTNAAESGAATKRDTLQPLLINIAFPDEGATIVSTQSYGNSLWGTTTRITVRLPDNTEKKYFLKTVTLGNTGKAMCQGEFESLQAMCKTSPGFCPEPYAWGQQSCLDSETYFLLVEFREIGLQVSSGRPIRPAEPRRLAAGLAQMHADSKSPTGKFGFHLRSCHARIEQAVDIWDDSWCNVYQRHLGHALDLAIQEFQWNEFDIVAKLTLEKVVPRLLLPLQSDGRILKPCLIHGNCWDGNTAMDAKTGKVVVFDLCSLYGHNEYDIGNWRAPRHRLSDKAYVQSYKTFFPISEPVEDWDARNLLYSLPYNIGNALYVPGSNQRPM
ncbi:hypothetical protein Golomagni_06082 [Golovinomyces magnicellulatus]|nr:hypothetical protein Golomagni_06082 [Golovinomyces magnicellulatus]